MPTDLKETVSAAVATARLEELQDGPDGAISLPPASQLDQRLMEARRIFYSERVLQSCARPAPAPTTAVTAA